MDRDHEYISRSLELHLFFARIMKEHALFLKVGFLPPGMQLASEGERLLRQFETLLSRAIALSDQVVRCSVLESGELFTPFTDCAEQQTQQLTGTRICRELTARTMQLTGRGCDDDFCVSPALLRQVQQLNCDGITLVERIIRYKERILDCVKSCQLFTVNYPLLIEHILHEARLYRAQLLRLEGCEDDCEELRSTETFWNRIMMEHALFIRGLLDPTEEKLICTADQFAKDYCNLLKASANANDKMIRHGMSVLKLTEKFRDFKRAGTEGIENCEIRSIILPLLADHVLREANHYLLLLE